MGFALAVGILVDESTVTIENIHHHLELGKSKSRAIWDACKEIATPKNIDFIEHFSSIRTISADDRRTAFDVSSTFISCGVCNDRIFPVVANFGSRSIELDVESNIQKNHSELRLRN